MRETKLTIIMYHYIRDLKKSRYPRIKGLDIHLFKEQLEYLKKHYNFVAIEQIIAAFDGKMDGENMLTGGACPLILFC